MIRKMGPFEVAQSTKDSFFNATELIKQWNKKNESDKRIKDFIKLSQTSEFIDELQKEVESQRDFSPHGDYQDGMRNRIAVVFLIYENHGFARFPSLL